MSWRVLNLVTLGILLASTATVVAQTHPADPKASEVVEDPNVGCGGKRFCKEMATCAEAVHYLTTCGQTSLDRDGDGIPCETVCGKTQSTMSERITTQPFTSVPRSLDAGMALVGGKSAPETTVDPVFACGSKRTCQQMRSCEEATFYLTNCKTYSLDGNRDGVPCNGLCR